MAMSLRWPASRSKRSGNCPECRCGEGKLEPRGALTLDGVEFYRVTCDCCGYTTLYDMSVARSTPYRGLRPRYCRGMTDRSAPTAES